MGWNESFTSVGLKEGGKETSACSSFLLQPEGNRCARVGCVWKCVLGACVRAPAGAVVAAGAGAGAAAAVVEVVVVLVVVLAAGREV